jgi:uncharacterized membrane protein
LDKPQPNAEMACISPSAIIIVHKGAIAWDPSAVILAGAHIKNPKLRKFFAISLFISPFYKTATAVAKNI